MALLVACMWGAIGAAAVDAAELYGAIRHVKNFPWRVQGELPLCPYLATVALRLAVGAFAAVICKYTGPTGPVAAAAAGVAGIKIVEELGRRGSKEVGAPTVMSLPSQPADGGAASPTWRNRPDPRGDRDSIERESDTAGGREEGTI